MSLHAQLTHKGIVCALDDFHHLALTSAATTPCKERNTHNIIGESMRRVALAYEHRVTAILGMELVIAILAAQECSHKD